MKETVGDTVQVKAAGGIRSWKTCKEMIDAGATRIGTSSSIQIYKRIRRGDKMKKIVVTGANRIFGKLYSKRKPRTI